MRVLALSAALCLFSLPLMAAEFSTKSAAIEREGKMARDLGMRSIGVAAPTTWLPAVLQCLEEIKEARFLPRDYSDERHKYFRVYEEGSLTPDYYLTVIEYGYKKIMGTRALIYVPPGETRVHGPVLAKILECMPVE